MTSVGSLRTSLAALQTHQQALDVASTNIANSSTAGFHRQRVDPTTGRVVRIADPLLGSRAARDEASSAAARTTATTLSRIEALVPEPSDDGLAMRLDDFWASWADLSLDPSSPTARQEVIGRADAVVADLRRVDAGFTALAAETGQRIAAAVDRLGHLATRVAESNGRILSRGPDPAVLDERDAAVAEMVRLTGVQARVDERGMVNLTLDGHPLVSGALPGAVTFVDGALRTAEGRAMHVADGELSALLAAVNDVVPRHRAAIDDVTARLVTAVNSLHAQGHGADGGSGRSFFDPVGTTAATISVSAAVRADPSIIAAGGPASSDAPPPGPMDGRQASALAALADAADGANARYDTFIGGLGVETRAGRERADALEALAAGTRREATAVGAVSIDEEMTQVLESQRAYQAAGRLLAVVDELLGFLIERTG